MPFPGGIDDSSNGTLIFAVLLAVAYLFLLAQPPSWRRTLVKAGGVVLLALLVVLQGGPALLALALLLSAAGDAFLSREGERPFLAGLASFLAAHLAYVALFWMAGEGLGFVAAQPWLFAVAAVMLAAVGVLLARLWPALDGTLRLPVAAYSAAILAMGLASLMLPLPLAILGAILFMASDSLLAVGRFLLQADSPHHVWAQPAIWALYFSAQLCITLAFVA